MILNLFYKEPETDRWFKNDRYPRRVIRRILRGKPQIGGVQRWFENLKEGLDKIGQEYRVNDFRYINNNPQEVAFVVGKEFLVHHIPDGVPIVFGPGVESHPTVCSFWGKKNIIQLLISCEWFRDIYKRDLTIDIPITIWPAGIQTEIWKPGKKEKDLIIVYDKIRWDREHYEPTLCNPIIDILKAKGYRVEVLRYGFYKEENYKALSSQAAGMVFLCEHETQGFAYLQALSSDVPIMAWDRGGYWKDPPFFPNIKFKDVTSVPYWDERCGVKFSDLKEFNQKIDLFVGKIAAGEFSPRAYIMDNLTLEKQAYNFVENARHVIQQTNSIV